METKARHEERPKASMLTIINFFLLCMILVTGIAILANIENQSNGSSASSGGNSTLEAQISALSNKIDSLSTSSQSSQTQSTSKPFNYLSCNGNITTIGSLSTLSSQCYPY